jgi:ribosomal protein S15P/S13E
VKPEDILMEELSKWEEHLDMVSEDQTAAFMLGILAHRCSKAELLVDYYRKRLESYEKKENGSKVREVEDQIG